MSLCILNPKRVGGVAGRAAWYPYYAGFSVEFAQAVITSANLDSTARVLDPWNGSGTTTVASIEAGHHVSGFDLNPVAVIVAKARLLAARERPSLKPLAANIVSRARRLAKSTDLGDDPLCVWFVPNSALQIRCLDRAIQHLLVDDERYRRILDRPMSDISGIASFFYLTLFRLMRTALSAFRTSNPTWIKTPSSTRHRLRPGPAAIFNQFLAHVEDMCDSMLTFVGNSADAGVSAVLATADASRLPVAAQSADLVLTSPPYCTRIDYAVATAPELAIVGASPAEFGALRRSLLGTTALDGSSDAPAASTSPQVTGLLKSIGDHKSKASRTYYHRTYSQYFAGLAAGLSQVRRATRFGGTAVIVVQDSYYKDVHVDLPAIVQELMGDRAWSMNQRVDFRSNKGMGNRHAHRRTYRKAGATTESVLVFRRTEDVAA